MQRALLLLVGSWRRMKVNKGGWGEEREKKEEEEEEGDT